jgi:DNA-directed RNA polymerase subunit RPC12/RpoP
MSKVQRLLEHLDTTKEVVPEEIHLRANHRSGLRCLSCGRKLLHIHSLPAVRTCPNDECGSKFQLSKKERGVAIRKL